MMIKDYRKIKKENEASSPFKCYFFILYFFFFIPVNRQFTLNFPFSFPFFKIQNKNILFEVSFIKFVDGTNREEQKTHSRAGSSTGWRNRLIQYSKFSKDNCKVLQFGQINPMTIQAVHEPVKKKYLHKKNSGHPVGQQASSAL